MARRGMQPKGGWSLPVVSDGPLMLELWSRALASPHGIKIRPGVAVTAHHLMNKLYAARRECGHKAYNDLRIVETTDGCVWILPHD